MCIFLLYGTESFGWGLALRCSPPTFSPQGPPRPLSFGRPTTGVVQPNIWCEAARADPSPLTESAT